MPPATRQGHGGPNKCRRTNGRPEHAVLLPRQSLPRPSAAKPAAIMQAANTSAALRRAARCAMRTPISCVRCATACAIALTRLRPAAARTARTRQQQREAPFSGGALHRSASRTRQRQISASTRTTALNVLLRPLRPRCVDHRIGAPSGLPYMAGDLAAARYPWRNGARPTPNRPARSFRPELSSAVCPPRRRDTCAPYFY
jgi:hypothetical protein